MTGDDELVTAIQNANTSTLELVSWLEGEAPMKNGPQASVKKIIPGTSKMSTWFRSPGTTSDPVKAGTCPGMVSLEAGRTPQPGFAPVAGRKFPEAYDSLAEQGVRSLMDFLEKEDIVTVKDYFEPAIREHLGSFVPAEERNFFLITAHHDPRPLFSHFTTGLSSPAWIPNPIQV